MKDLERLANRSPNQVELQCLRFKSNSLDAHRSLQILELVAEHVQMAGGEFEDQLIVQILSVLSVDESIDLRR